MQAHHNHTEQDSHQHASTAHSHLEDNQYAHSTAWHRTHAISGEHHTPVPGAAKWAFVRPPNTNIHTQQQAHRVQRTLSSGVMALLPAGREQQHQSNRDTC